MKKRLIGATVATAALIAALAGCAPSSDPADPGASGDKPYIAIISKGFQHQFWQAVKAGAEQAAEEFGVEISFEGPDLKKKTVKVDANFVRKQLADIVKDQDLSRYIL